jgi:integrase
VLPPLTELAARYNVAVGSAHRAVALLTEEELVVAARGQRTRVA